MKTSKIESILDDLDNGNISAFKAVIKTLTKLELLELIEFAAGQGISSHLIINKIKLALEF